MENNWIKIEDGCELPKDNKDIWLYDGRQVFMGWYSSFSNRFMLDNNSVTGITHYQLTSKPEPPKNE